jgi:hypothetical protein
MNEMPPAVHGSSLQNFLNRLQTGEMTTITPELKGV